MYSIRTSLLQRDVVIRHSRLFEATGSLFFSCFPIRRNNIRGVFRTQEFKGPFFFPFITVAGSERLAHTSETVFILMEDLHKADIRLLSS